MAKIRLCEIGGCSKKHSAKGFCKAHLYKFQKYGNPLAGKTLTPKGEALEFLRDLLNNEREECVYWPYYDRGGIAKSKYGGVYYNGRMELAHRVGCEWLNGPPPSEAHEAAHNCGQGREGCVNPFHTRWATPKQNSADQIDHGTRRRGSQISTTKLTPEDVINLRRDMALGGTQVATAAMYGISRRNLRAIMAGKYWSWV